MKPIIFGIEGEKLTQEEIDFFQEVKPFGYILFKRNCKNKEQVTDLVESLKKLSHQKNLPILIDQEGGRVSRLKEPEFKEYPAAHSFINSSNIDLEDIKKNVYQNYFEIGKDLFELGITFNCAPVADILFPETHSVIGDRAFGDNDEIVATLARESAQALLDAKIYPIIKHIPGHGRATADSHFNLPIVTASLSELEHTDFKVFSALKDLPFAMTAHIIYTSIDENEPVTTSKIAIDYIRSNIGFSGILMSDDLSMEALSGSMTNRAIKSLESGCDLLLHCNGNMIEMVEIANAVPDYFSDKLSKFINEFNS